MVTKFTKYRQDSASCRNMAPKSAKSPPKSAKRRPKRGFRPLRPRSANRLWRRGPLGAPSRARIYLINQVIKELDMAREKIMKAMSLFKATGGVSSQLMYLRARDNLSVIQNWIQIVHNEKMRQRK